MAAFVALVFTIACSKGEPATSGDKSPTPAAETERCAVEAEPWSCHAAGALRLADQLEMQAALEVGRRARAECEAAQARCPSATRVKLDLFASRIDAGIASGIDPKEDPEAFRAAMDRATPRIQLRPPNDGPTK